VLNIVMLVKDRPRLTRQALESLVENTHGPWNLTIVDDDSSPETVYMLWDWRSRNRCIPSIIAAEDKHLGPGRARNFGISLSEITYGRTGLLYTTDNDSYHLPGWDKTLLEVWNSPLRRSEGFEAIGGYAHAYQRPISQIQATAGHSLNELAALGLFSWLMEWETYDKHGPFEPSTTINGSEDWAMSQKIRKAGGKVGAVTPALVVNCGVISSDGKPCPGAATLWEQEIPPGVILE